MHTILAIDDSREAITSVRVAARGWRFLAATSAEEALRVIATQLDEVDVVVLDLFLPNLDGPALCAQIRARRIDLPIIVFTGHPEALREVEPFGIAERIIKPAESREIRRVLQQAIGLASAPSPAQHPLHLYSGTPIAMAPSTAPPLLERGATANAESDERPELAPIRSATLDDLDLDKADRHIQRAIARRGYAGSEDVIAYLRVHECIVGEGRSAVPTHAGILAFGIEPQRFIPCEIDIARFTTLEEEPDTIDKRRIIKGTIFTLIDEALETLETLNPHRSRMEGAERIDEYTYHPRVLREAVINAVLHRDLSIRGAGIQIKIFPNRIEIVSPGGLPEGVRVDNLREARVIRNPALAELLRNGGYVEKFGIGYKVIYRILAEWGLGEPQLHDSGTFFTITIPARTFALQQQQQRRAPPIPAHLNGRLRQILEAIDARGGKVKRGDLAPLIKDIGERQLQRELSKLIGMRLLFETGKTSDRYYYRYNPNESSDMDMS